MNRRNLRVWDPLLNKGAIWTYWKGAYRDDGKDAGATLVIQTGSKKGWFWYIPLHDDVVSCGVVAPFDYLFKGRTDYAKTYEEEVEHCPGVKERVRSATRVTGYFATKDYSYRSKQVAGDGWVLVGDAFGFLDPLYSSGVLLALKSGELAADAVVEGLAKGDTSEAQLGKWGPTFNEGVDRMRRLVCEYYDGFSFGRMIRQYPEMRGTITDLLIGDLFDGPRGQGVGAARVAVSRRQDRAAALERRHARCRRAREGERADLAGRASTVAAVGRACRPPGRLRSWRSSPPAGRFARCAARAGQPTVVADMAAGILLGPSLLGLAGARRSADGSFPPDAVAPLAQIAQARRRALHVPGRRWSSTSSMRARSCASTAAGRARRHRRARGARARCSPSGSIPRLMPAGPPLWQAALFLGVAMAMTAFPVLARILADTGLIATPLGTRALSCAAMADVIVWAVLGVVVGAFEQGADAAALAPVVARGLRRRHAARACGRWLRVRR